MKTCAIIGSGNVGSALAATLARAGHLVRLGRRNPEASSDAPAGIGVMTPREAAEGADFVFLAVPAVVALTVGRELRLPSGPGAPVLVDCTNPVAWDQGPVHAPPPAGSVADELQAGLPGIPVLKALNHFGAEIHADPQAYGNALALVAGDDPHAREALVALLTGAGFTAVDAGPLRNAALLEALAVLWIHLSTRGGFGREWAFGRVEKGG